MDSCTINREVKDLVEDLKRTPLYQTHVAHGGKIIDFEGWALPVQFTSIIDEHRAVRHAAGLFDVSDMGEIMVEGADSLALLQLALTNNMERGRPGQVIYSPMCNEQGGVVDDLLIYCMGNDRYMLVVNAGNIEKDYQWLQGLAARFSHVSVSNESDDVGQIALQGPNSQAILQELTDCNLDVMKYYHFEDKVNVGGIEGLVSRTGYTGEDGFEVYCKPKDTPVLWEALMANAASWDLVPAGLGCRDTLRFEAGMPLYGQELDDERTPVEAKLSKFIDFTKEEFVGRERLLKQKEEKPKIRLIGFEMLGRGIPRTGYPLLSGGEEVGYVTTGSFAPSLNKNLGMGYVPWELRKIGTDLVVQIRNREVEARVVKTPFYRKGK